MEIPRHALVTGGASGIGRATVERLARDGCQVHLVDRNADATHATATTFRNAGLSVEPHVLDLRDEAAVRALVAGLPPLTVLVNNAGLFDERRFMEVGSDDFQRMFDVNVIPLTVLTQAAAVRMPRDGRIVNIASRAALGALDYPHYATSKAAVVGYTRASAMELAPRGISVNAVAPGLIDTPILSGVDPARLRAAAEAPVPAMGHPEDIAQAVAFFAAPGTRFITGQVLYVDGGRSVGLVTV